MNELKQITRRFIMKKSSFDEKLIIEKEKLNKLADEAVKKGISLIQDKAFMEQNRKVDELVVKAQRYQEKQRKKQQER
jgi:polyhydroxyalkanoate synthesis regulator phasin